VVAACFKIKVSQPSELSIDLQLRKYFTQISSFVIQIGGSDCSKNLGLKSKVGVDKVFKQRSSLN
jgi:hypothetical protein